jgi:hypothetical protein
MLLEDPKGTPSGVSARDSTSLTASSNSTPHTTSDGSTALDDPHDGFSGLLPDKTYMIIETKSLRALTLTQNRLCLKDIDQGASGLRNRWLCVQENGWMGLQDPESGRYIGHDGRCGMRASATEFRAWEFIVPRDRPGGAYQLLVPYNWQSLRPIVVAEDGESLVMRQHGDTQWRFIRVS